MARHAAGPTVDERRIRLQLNLVRVTYRGEAPRLDKSGLQAFRDRARDILDNLAAQATASDGLRAEIAEIRREIGA